MTDTSYSYLRCRRADAGRFQRLGYDLQDDKDGIAELFDSQADYGNSTQLEKLSHEGVVFYAWHGAGDEYGPCVQASDGQRFVDVDGDDSGYPVVRVLKNGRLDRQRLREARLYWMVYERARKAVGEVSDE